MKIRYDSSISFRESSLFLIRQADEILSDYAKRGFDLTLRQLYYQFVARNIIPNKDTEYKRLGGIINDARLAGLIDWNHIVDRTRNLRTLAAWDSPYELVNSAANQWRSTEKVEQPKQLRYCLAKT